MTPLYSSELLLHLTCFAKCLFIDFKIQRLAKMLAEKIRFRGPFTVVFSSVNGEKEEERRGMF